MPGRCAFILRERLHYRGRRTYVDGQCGKLVTVIGSYFITLTVDICVQHSGREALRRAGLSAEGETCPEGAFL